MEISQNISYIVISYLWDFLVDVIGDEKWSLSLVLVTFASIFFSAVWQFIGICWVHMCKLEVKSTLSNAFFPSPQYLVV